jgi:hypothetical protein
LKFFQFRIYITMLEFFCSNLIKLNGNFVSRQIMFSDKSFNIFINIFTQILINLFIINILYVNYPPLIEVEASDNSEIISQFYTTPIGTVP